MKKSPKSSTAMFIALMLVVLAGLIHGCASKEWFGGGQGASDPRAKFQPAGEKDLQRFSSAIRKVDGSAEAHYRLALYFQERYRHRLAIDELGKAIQASPFNFKAYNAIGVSYDNLGEHDAAIENYKIALKIDPKLDYVHNNLGYSHLLNGDFQGAVQAFQAAIAINGAEKRYRNNLGLAYVKLDQYELAIEQFKVGDTEVNAVTKLARVMRELGKSGDAEQTAVAMRQPPATGSPVVEGQGEPLPAAPAVAAAAASPAANPVARYQVVMGELNRPDDPSVGPSAIAGPRPPDNPAAAGNPGEAESQATREAVTRVETATLKGPVIHIPAAPQATGESSEAAIASTRSVRKSLRVPVEEPSAQPQPVYHTASADFEKADAAAAPPVSAPTKMEAPRSPPVAKEPRKIMPPHITEVAPASREIEEERILTASATINAGAWQTAPEPARTINETTGIIEIEVENGNGVKNAAARVARHLRNSGFKVVRVADANSFDHYSTKVFYCSGNLAQARRLLDAIPEITKDAELYEIKAMGNGVRLLIGKDLVEKNRELAWGKPRGAESRVGG